MICRFRENDAFVKNKMLWVLCIAACLGLHVFLWWRVDEYKYSGVYLPSWLLDLFDHFLVRHIEEIPNSIAVATLWVGSFIWVVIGVAIAYFVHAAGTVNRRKV